MKNFKINRKTGVIIAVLAVAIISGAIFLNMNSNKPDYKPVQEAQKTTQDIKVTAGQSAETVKPAPVIEVKAPVKQETTQPEPAKPAKVEPKPQKPAETTPAKPTPTKPKDKSTINVPGFGEVEDQGGGGQGSTVGNPDDKLTGNKVGTMD